MKPTHYKSWQHPLFLKLQHLKLALGHVREAKRKMNRTLAGVLLMITMMMMGNEVFAQIHMPLFVGSDESYVFVYLGSPPQEVLVLVDSGSATLAVPVPDTSCSCVKAPECVVPCATPTSASPASNCSPAVGKFNQNQCSCSALPCSGPSQNLCFPTCTAPLNSNNLADNSCVYGSYNKVRSSTSSLYIVTNGTCCTGLTSCGGEVTYGDNSGFQGTWVRDKLTFGSSSVSVPFVEITTVQTGLAYFQEAPAAGILGIGYDVLNSFIAPTLSAMYSCITPSCASYVPAAPSTFLAGAGLPNIISLCFNQLQSGSGVGVAVFGGEYPGVQYQYFAIISDSYYVIDVTALRIGTSTYTAAAQLNAGQAIVDTGNGGFLSLPGPVYTYMCNTAAPAQTCQTDNDCSIMISIRLYNSAASATNPLFGSGVCGSNKRCACSNGVRSASQLVLGYLSLQGGIVVFDRVNNRLGFGTGTCNPACSLFQSQLSCQSVTYCMWQGSACVAAQAPPAASESSSSFNAPAFVTAFPIMLGLLTAASFVVYHCYHHRPEPLPTVSYTRMDEL